MLRALCAGSRFAESSNSRMNDVQTSLDSTVEIDLCVPGMESRTVVMGYQHVLNLLDNTNNKLLGRTNETLVGTISQWFNRKQTYVDTLFMVYQSAPLTRLHSPDVLFSSIMYFSIIIHFYYNTGKGEDNLACNCINTSSFVGIPT